MMKIQVDHNRDGIDHRGVRSDNVFKSKTLDTDERFSLYSRPAWPPPLDFCSIYPQMPAQTVVQWALSCHEPFDCCFQCRRWARRGF